MANPDAAVPAKPIVPAITGNPFIDTALRVLLTSAAAAITAIIVTWLAAHGYNDPNMALMVGGGVLSVLIGAVTVIWSFLQTKLNQTNTVHQVINAVATGVIPDNIMKVAIASPKVSDVQIMKASDNAETIKVKNNE